MESTEDSCFTCLFSAMFQNMQDDVQIEDFEHHVAPAVKGFLHKFPQLSPI